VLPSCLCGAVCSAFRTGLALLLQNAIRPVQNQFRLQLCLIRTVAIGCAIDDTRRRRCDLLALDYRHRICTCDPRDKEKTHEV
jgi:hypothetical protein